MKIAFKNFIQTLRRYKMASLLNIAGLTLAFTAFYIILVQVCWEMGYNRSLYEENRTYLVETEDWYELGMWDSWVNRPVSERVIASTPGVEASGCIWGGFGDGTCWTQNPESFGYNKFTASSGSVSASVLDLFAFHAVEGDLRDFTNPNSVLISRETATRMNIGVGDLLWVDKEEPKPGEAQTVVAVFEDFRDNTLLGGCKVVKNLGEHDIDQTSQWNYNYYIRLRADTDPADFARRWKEVLQEMKQEEHARLTAAGETPEEDDDDIYSVRLSPIASLYFESDSGVPCKQGSAATTYTLLGIAALVIVLAFINFVNFFFALVPVRVRTVNTFKVFGAPTSSLRFSFVFEAVGLVVLSLLAAWYLSYALQGSEFASYISMSLALSENLPVVGILAAVAFAMALAASLYPAWYITSFSPAMVIKGSFAGTRGGRRLRMILLGIQFFISLALVIATCFIHLQHRYMMNYDMGFDKENLLAVRNTGPAAQKYAALRSKLLSQPQVRAVTSASSQLVSENRMGWGRDYKGREINFECYVVEWNFLQMMGISILEGRDFLESDEQQQNGTLIFNRTAQLKYDIVVGDRMNGFQKDEPIVGVCEDFNFRSLQYGVSPFAFYIQPAETRAKGYHVPMVVYVRTTEGADVTTVADYIRSSIAELDPRSVAGDIRVRNFDEELGEQYTKEHRLTVIVGAFSLLAVVIALMGVFGIVLFETQHRRREIAVRKVMGATTGEVLEMFNIRYLRVVAICFVLAIPVCIWGLHRWLSVFAYRVPLSWWVFVLALAAVAAVTALTVTSCVWRTANENPADSVKSE